MARGGKRPGAGRKRGSKNPETLEKERVLAALRQRIMRNTDLIFDSQLSIARGQQFLYRIDKDWIPTGKDRGYWKPKKPILVEDPEEIRMFLENLVEKGEIEDDQDSGAAYYFITTKEPNNQAIDSMFNRAFGKAKETSEVTLHLPTPLLENVRGNNGNKEDSPSQ